MSLLFLDLPPKTFVGLDLLSFNSSPNFHGISGVSVDLHFVYTGADASLSIRHGRWINLETPNTILIFKWDATEESLKLLSHEDPAARHAISAISSLRASGLITYAALEAATTNLQHSSHTDEEAGTSTSSSLQRASNGGYNGTSSDEVVPSPWRTITAHIQQTTLSRLLPSHNTITSLSSAPMDSDAIPGLTQSEVLSALPPNSTLALTPLDLKQTWADGDLGRIRTLRARDRSWLLGQVMDSLAAGAGGGGRKRGAKELLAELQVCFVMVLTLMNYSCMEQWKRILAVVFTCEEAVGEVGAWFAAVVGVLRAQLEREGDVEGGLFEMRDEAGSGWLRGLLGKFRGTVEEVAGDGSPLERELRGLEEMLRERYGWEVGRGVLKRGMLQLEDGEMVEVEMDGADEDDERGDWAPVVVET
jgi:A1 cistron-splicing factor AAR2